MIKRTLFVTQNTPFVNQMTQNTHFAALIATIEKIKKICTGSIPKTKWKFSMAFVIKRQPPNPLNGTNFHPFLPHFFLLQLNLPYIKRILHVVSVKNITFKSSGSGR